MSLKIRHRRHKNFPFSNPSLSKILVALLHLGVRSDYSAKNLATFFCILQKFA